MRWRPHFVTLMAATASLAVAGELASATADSEGKRQIVDYRFTTDRPGTSTGIHAQIHYQHPSDPKAKPIPVRREVFVFPKGTRFEPDVVPECRASDEELRLRGEDACPSRSRVLGGTGTTMTGIAAFDPVATEVDGFNHATGIRLLATVPAFGFRVVTRAVRDGRTITVEIPRAPGGPPDGESALRDVDNLSKARSKRGRHYVRTPSRCPASGRWRFIGRFTYADGVTQTVVSRQRCNRH